MSSWRRYDAYMMPAFHERFEQRWGKGTAPFLDPEVHKQPMPGAQWINVDTGAGVAVVPVWTDEDDVHRSFAVFYLPPAGDIWILRPGITDYIQQHHGGTEAHIALRKGAFKKAVAHAKDFIHGTEI